MHAGLSDMTALISESALFSCVDDDINLSRRWGQYVNKVQAGIRSKLNLNNKEKLLEVKNYGLSPKFRHMGRQVMEDFTLTDHQDDSLNNILTKSSRHLNLDTYRPSNMWKDKKPLIWLDRPLVTKSSRQLNLDSHYPSNMWKDKTTLSWLDRPEVIKSSRHLSVDTQRPGNMWKDKKSLILNKKKRKLLLLLKFFTSQSRRTCPADQKVRCISAIIQKLSVTQRDTFEDWLHSNEVENPGKSSSKMHSRLSSIRQNKEFIPVHQLEPCRGSDTQLNNNAVWLNQPWKSFIRSEDLTSLREDSSLSCNLPCHRKHEEGKSNQGASLTLRESVGLKWGSVLPLDFVSRIHSSKLWVMEADNKADLLIICRWANPIYLDDVKCGICNREWFNPVRMSCGDTFCAGCVRDQFANGSKICPKCQKNMKKKFQPNEDAQKLLRLYKEERDGLTGYKRRRDDEHPQPVKKPCISDESDVTLNVDHIMIVFEVLYEAREHWFFIGNGIGCTSADLDEMRAKYPSDQRMCLLQVLQSRIQQGGLTCSMLCDSLRKKYIGRDDMAQKIEDLELV